MYRIKPLRHKQDGYLTNQHHRWVGLCGWESTLAEQLERSLWYYLNLKMLDFFPSPLTWHPMMLSCLSPFPLLLQDKNGIFRVVWYSNPYIMWFEYWPTLPIALPINAYVKGQTKHFVLLSKLLLWHLQPTTEMKITAGLNSPNFEMVFP